MTDRELIQAILAEMRILEARVSESERCLEIVKDTFNEAAGKIEAKFYDVEGELDVVEEAIEDLQERMDAFESGPLDLDSLSTEELVDLGLLDDV